MNKSAKNLEIKRGCLSSRSVARFVMAIACAALIAGAGRARADWPGVAMSKDGVPISYEARGQGEPTLIFVHGWSCDARYWREQIGHFSRNHRVVALDLAGHGHSGMARETYLMSAFGEDILAVADAVGARKVILIGHSMGGPVIAEAAALMPGRVIGLIGVDTFEDVKYPLTEEALKHMLGPLEQDFQAGARAFVGSMMRPDSDPALSEWILADMSSAPPAVAMSAIKEMLNQYITGESAAVFARARVPVATVNADMWPINYETNRNSMLSFEAIVLKDADHFLMMNRPDEFNRALEQAIEMLASNPENR
jgi:pimeloyl-ACP methyl ester carboxylesterase